jgi:hypothetical protein
MSGSPSSSRLVFRSEERTVKRRLEHNVINDKTINKLVHITGRLVLAGAETHCV